MSGPLALVGGAEWTEGCRFDRALVDEAKADEVLVLPTAAAYEHPERAVSTADTWFRAMGVPVRGLMVLRRPDALDEANVEAVRSARFIYLGGGSPMHLRSVLMHSPLWQALVAAWNDGAVVVGSSAGAMVLCDPMVDPRGGAFTVGLALLEQVAVIPHHDTWSEDKQRRTLDLAPAGLPVVGIDERTALVRSPGGMWRAEGAGQVTVYVDGAPADLAALP
ncbi:MAG: Type 1 glutamine amidotransferase-like domain-containing protein [Acidimicrobiales bacterium]